MTDGVVVIATTGSRSCWTAARRAADLFPDADVLVVSVTREVPPAGDRPTVRALARRLEHDAAEALVAATCRAVGPRARGVVVTGEPCDEIRGLAARERASTIVVGRLSDHPLLDSLRGSVAGRLGSNPPCPVLELGRGPDPGLSPGTTAGHPPAV